MNEHNFLLDRFRGQSIVFPYVDEPVVSVIIPVYRGLDDLQNCLRSLAAFIGSEPDFEVILVDDCPSEPVIQEIPDSGGLVKVSNSENQGFLLTCNRGAGKSRGRFLCFLNSDTIVTQGWLSALVEAFEETPKAAVIGSMLLNPDGSIQDCGWSITKNGWGYPVGRGGDPRNGAYTYRRQVDCVTGACFLVAEKIFREMGGFDPLYAPAFYEEFDFAFRVRAQGLKVIYEPRSKVVHWGSASYGADMRDRLSKRNHSKFVDRFADALLKHPSDTGDEFLLRKGREKGPVILIADQSVPCPDRHAGSIDMIQYLERLAKAGWHVVFAPLDGKADANAAEILERRGIEFIRHPWTIEGWLAKNGRHLDYVWLPRPDLADGYIDAIKAQSAALILH